MWITAYTLGLPWYIDLAATAGVLILGFFIIGVAVRLLVNYRIGDVVFPNGYERTLTTEERVAEYTRASRENHKLGWGIALTVLTGVFWPAAPMLVVTAGVLTALILGFIGLVHLGDKTAGGVETLKESAKRRAELVKRAEEENDEWLKSKLDEIEKEYTALVKERSE